MLAIRSQLLETVRGAYPETFEGPVPPNPPGESVFDGPTPHPNEVLNLFIQHEFTSALPMAYYMAARRGLDSLMDRRLPRNATLSPDALRSAVRGLTELREEELRGTHRLIFGRKCSSCTSDCCSDTPYTYQRVFDHIVGPSQQGTRALQFPEFYLDCEMGHLPVFSNVCGKCVERWESGHAYLRKRTWEKLPDVFGLKG
jgi:hypothetical protein